MSKKNFQALVAKVAAHEVFGQFRFITTDDGEIWFVAVDVCKILGYKNSRKALADHVDDEDKRPDVTIRYTSSNGVIQNRKVNVINESGLYSLIFGSQLPAAKKFTRWVTSEVLPSIRKTGSYSVAPKQKSIAEILLEDYKNNNIELTEITLPNGKTALMPVRDIENFQKMKKKYPDFRLQLVHIVE